MFYYAIFDRVELQQPDIIFALFFAGRGYDLAE